VTRDRLTVVRGGLPFPPAAPGEVVVTDSELRSWVLDGRIVTSIARFREARLLTERVATSGRPMLAWALRAVARGRCSIVDTEGQSRTITIALLIAWSWQVVRELAAKAALLRRVAQEVERLEQAPPQPTPLPIDAPALYLRSDLSFGIRAGGSVGHIAGVLNALAERGHPPIFVSTTSVPTVSPCVETHYVAVPERFWNFKELPTFVLNDACFDEAVRAVAGRPIGFVYQRYSLNNSAGLRLARQLAVPFVLEYNGSEIWMSRHWKRPLLYEELASRIELVNVRRADLVVVVSRAMREELVARGADPDRVLVNPNAVDPDRYSPRVDGGCVRRQLDLGNRTVLGFIATFGPWHGTGILVRAFVELMDAHPEYRDSVRLLMIGDGVEADHARREIEMAGLRGVVHFTGLVPQEAGPTYLAACDIFVSPHVPNPDGTPFFGSPTKLFEYMAMGKGIVASDLDQIGEVLRHGDTGWLVPPADVAALAEALHRLVQDAPLRERLGAAARREVLTHHTWRAHLRRTLDALDARVHASMA
jgi:glycosyltransferase involved in cell wall biosynthesis